MTEFTKKLNGYFIAFCRRSFHWSPAYKEARKRAFVGKRDGKDYFICGECRDEFIGRDTHVDHILPVVPTDGGFTSWDTYRDRMFCTAEGLRVLCITCHKAKTKAENALRYKNKTGCYSVEAVKSISEAQKGHTYLKGIPKTLGHCRAMSTERRGKPQSDRRRKAHDSMINGRKKPVIAQNIKTGVWSTFLSVADAAKELDIDACNITRVCNRKQGRTQAKGYVFKYADK